MERKIVPIGLKGTINALFLKDLAIKTHRDLEGRAKAGKCVGVSNQRLMLSLSS